MERSIEIINDGIQDYYMIEICGESICFHSSLEYLMYEV